MVFKISVLFIVLLKLCVFVCQEDDTVETINAESVETSTMATDEADFTILTDETEEIGNYTEVPIADDDEAQDEKLQHDGTLAGNFAGYTVLSVTPASQAQLEGIFRADISNKYLIWSHKFTFGQPIIIAVPPNDSKLRAQLQIMKVEYRITVKDLYLAMFRNRVKNRKKPPMIASISFTTYHRYENILDYVKRVVARYPETTKLIQIGKSYENRELIVLQITARNKNKRREEKNNVEILLEAGMHGREWLGVSLALYAIHQLVELGSSNRNLLEGIVWYILPVLNPDGYEHTFVTDRYWKNNRRNTNNCSGADLDRNFDVGGLLMEEYACNHIFGGEHPFSEPETKSFRQFIKSRDIKMYLSLHSGDSFVAYPWGYRKDRTEEDELLNNIAIEMTEAIEKNDEKKRTFSVGHLSNITGPYAGCAIDWAMKRASIKFPYMISLHGGNEAGFDVPLAEIYKNVVLHFEAIKVSAKRMQILDSKFNVKDVQYNKIVTMPSSNFGVSSRNYCTSYQEICLYTFCINLALISKKI